MLRAMNSGEAFETQVVSDLSAAFPGASFEKHGTADDSFSNDISVSGMPGCLGIEAKQMRAPTGQFTLAVEDGTLVWSESTRCLGEMLEETVEIIDWLNRGYPDPSRLVEAVMHGRTTVPITGMASTVSEWVRKYYRDLKGNRYLIAGVTGTRLYGIADLDLPGALDGMVTACVRKRTSGTRPVPARLVEDASSALSSHLEAIGCGGPQMELSEANGKTRAYCPHAVPGLGRRDRNRYFRGLLASYYISPARGQIRVLSAGAGNPCVSFWGDFRGMNLVPISEIAGGHG